MAKMTPGLGGIHIGPLIVGVDNFYYHITTNQSRTVSEHLHGWFEFSQPLSGEICYLFDRGSAEASSESTILIPSGLAHGWVARKAPIVIMSFLLQIRPIGESGHNLLERLVEMLRLANYHFTRDPLARQLEDAIWEAIDRNAGIRLLQEKIHSLLRAYIVNFFHTHLSELFEKPKFGDLDETTLSENELLVDQIMDYIGGNLGTPLRIEELATHFHFSPRHLNRIFKEQTGEPIGAYVMNRRLQESCTQLVTTNLSVKRIAYELGFTDSSYFCRFFRNEIGYTPSQYRKHEHGQE